MKLIFFVSFSDLWDLKSCLCSGGSDVLEDPTWNERCSLLNIRMFRNNDDVMYKG